MGERYLVYTLEFALVGALPTSGQTGDALSASLKYHMEESLVGVEAPSYNLMVFAFFISPDLTLKLMFLSVMGASL